MKAARRMKNLTNQSWFKAPRGGRDLTPRKDLPHWIQEKELSKRTRSKYIRKPLYVRIEGEVGEENSDVREPDDVGGKGAKVREI